MLDWVLETLMKWINFVHNLFVKLISLNFRKKFTYE